MIEILVISIATAVNFLILKWKFEHRRYADLVFDLATLLALASLFGGTLGGMVITMVSGALVSFFLLLRPPKLHNPLKGLFRNPFKHKPQS